jgi:hypothetical protein
MLVSIQLNEPLGADLGPFNITSNVGSVVPSTASRNDLISGIIATVSISATTITVTSNSSSNCPASSLTMSISGINNNQPQSLKLTFDNITNADALVGDSSDVADWNTFFDLPTYGNPFTSVEVVGNEIRLLGGSDIVVREYLFVNNPLDPFTSQNVGLVSIDDSIGCIIEVQEGAFFCGSKNIIDGFSSDAIGKNGVDGNYTYLDATGGGGQDVEFDVNVSSGVVDDIQLSTGGYNYQIGNTLTILGSQFGGVDGVDDITITVTSIYNTGQTLTSVNLPACTLISNFSGSSGAFQSCTQLTTVNIPLLEEVFFAFVDCTSLTTIDFPSLTTAGYQCFIGCTSLTTVILPSLTTAGYELFYDCTSLTIIDFPLLTSAGSSCFYNCTSLQTVNLPNLTTAGDSCFSYCSSLVTLNLPALTTAGNLFIEDCTNLETVDLPLLTDIDSNIFLSCPNITTVNLSSLVTTTGFGFSNLSNLTTVNLSSLTAAPISFFFNCVSLTTISLPALTAAGNSCFSNCINLTNVDLPVLTIIETGGFLNCTSLTSINLPSCTNLGETVGVDFVFQDVSGNNITLTIPSALMTANAGNPDGDIQYLQANNTVTVITT